MYGAKERWEVDTILRIMGCVMFVKTHVDLRRGIKGKSTNKNACRVAGIFICFIVLRVLLRRLL